MDVSIFDFWASALALHFITIICGNLQTQVNHTDLNKEKLAYRSPRVVSICPRMHFYGRDGDGGETEGPATRH